MHTKRTLAALVLGVLALGAALGWGARARAGGPKPAIEVTFGPIQAEGNARATFFLALRNTGAADARLALGDTIEIRYGTGGGAGDLLAAGETLGVDPLPAGIALQRLTGAPSAETGVRLAVEGDVTIAAGTALVLTFDGATAAPGGAPVALALRLSKTAGRYPRSLTQTVVKTLPALDVSLYGDGSDGPLVLDADADLQALRNPTDVLVREGVTVTVASGTTIRCTGSFENRGRIVVLPGSPGGGVTALVGSVPGQLEPPFATVERGDAREAAQVPSVRDQEAVSGGRGGVGLGTHVHSLPLSHYRSGGGGGAGTLGAVGGAGGGLLRVVARGPIRNGGRIEAPGGRGLVNRSGLPGGTGAGAGGGGGGIVILASGTSVDNTVPANGNGGAATGTIDVSGGDGGTPDLSGGGGGGGGGGLVVLCAPSVPSNGVMDLANGLTASGNLQNDDPSPVTIWAGGGGGGACVGDGGEGSPVRADGRIGPAPGTGGDLALPQPGLLVVRTADPRTLWW